MKMMFRHTTLLLLVWTICFSAVAAVENVRSDAETVEMDFFRKKKKVRYIEHTVNVGEDLYSILNRYQVTLSDIEKDNTADILRNLSPGTVIKIDRTKLGTATPEKINKDLNSEKGKELLKPAEHTEPEKEPESVSEKEPVVVDSDRYTEHLVKRGETLFSIGQRYKISVPELRQLNADLLAGGVLVEGVKLKVPQAEALFEMQNKTKESINEIANNKILKRYNASQEAVVALMLPLKRENGGYEKQFLEFYQGFLIGLDSVKREGVSVQVKLFDTGRGTESVRSILESGELNNVDLIVGPVYESQFCDVAAFAVNQAIPIVSPLAAVGCKNSSVFQMAPTEATKYDKLKSHLAGKKIIFVRSINDDEGFIEQVRQLSDGDCVEMNFNPKALPEHIVQNQMSLEKPNLFVVSAKKGDLADAILSKLSAVKTFSTVKQMSVLGSSHIARMSQINPAHLFKLNMSMITPYHVDRTNPLVVEFDNRYIAAYTEVPSLYAYRGYDVALLFFGAMIEYGNNFMKFMDGYQGSVLQVKYHFKQDGAEDGYINDEWCFVNYMPNYSITVR